MKYCRLSFLPNSSVICTYNLFVVDSYEGHSFFFTEVNSDRRITSITATSSQILYLIEASSAQDKRKVDPKMVDITEKQMAFMENYFRKNKIPWRHYFGEDGPRGPPELYMWHANYLNQIHEVVSEHSHWYSINLTVFSSSFYC